MGLFRRRRNRYSYDPSWSGANSSVLSGRHGRVKPDGVDPVVVFITAALVSLGCVMVYSASISLVDSPKFHTGEYFFLFRHLVFVGIGTCAAIVVWITPLRLWKRAALPVAVISIILLAAVLVPGIGRVVNGSRRWIALGPINIQVSEICKFAMLLVASHFTVSRQDFMHSFTRGFLPLALVMGLVASLTALQPDLGATAVIVSIALGILFLGGIDLRIILPVGMSAIGAAVLMIVLSPWRVGRVMAFLNPWDSENALGKGYQLSHSLIAFGRGEWFGVGLGGSVEKLSYLPEAHTDFILAVIAEELGFVGVICVLFAYYWLVRRAFAIGRQAIKLSRPFAGLIAQGVGIWIGIQVLINGAVATGLFPTKGLTLPLISYGGSSLVATMAAIALLLRVDCENRILMRGGMV